MSKPEHHTLGGIALKVVQPAPLIVIDTPHQAHYAPETLKVGYLDFNPENAEYPTPHPTQFWNFLAPAALGLEHLLGEISSGQVTQPDILVGQTNSATARLAEKLGFAKLNPLRDLYYDYHLDHDMDDDQLIEVTHDLIMSPQIIALFQLVAASPTGQISAQNRKNILRFVKNSFDDPVSTAAYFFQIVDMIGVVGMNEIWKTKLTESQFEQAIQQTAVVLGLDLLLLDGHVIYVSWSDFLDQIAKLRRHPISRRLKASPSIKL